MFDVIFLFEFIDLEFAIAIDTCSNLNFLTKLSAFWTSLREIKSTILAELLFTGTDNKLVTASNTFNFNGIDLFVFNFI